MQTEKCCSLLGIIRAVHQHAALDLMQQLHVEQRGWVQRHGCLAKHDEVLVEAICRQQAASPGAADHTVLVIEADLFLML